MTYPLSSPENATFHILIVDDEENVLDVIRDYLFEFYQYSIDTAKSGAEALSRLSVQSYDAIISDYEMEGMNGIDLLKSIRSQGNHTPFIIFTGKGREEVVVEAFENGGNGYVLKGGEINSQFAELSLKLKAIIEKKQTEAALRESQEWFQDIFWNSPIGIGLYDEKGFLVKINPAFSDIFGIPSLDVIQGYNLLKDSSIPEQELQLIRENKPVRYFLPYTLDQVKNKNRYDTSKDTTITLDILVTPIKKDGDAISGYLVQLMDITEQLKNQEDIANQKKFLDQLMETIPSPVFYKNRSGIVGGCNHAFEKFIGSSRDQIIGKTVHDIAPGNLADLYQAMDDELFMHPGMKEYESTIESGDGTLHDVIFQKATIIGPNKTPEGIIGLIIDISDQKDAEKQIRKSEENFRIFFESIGDMIVVGTPEGKILYTNQALVQKLEYSLERLKNLHIIDLHPPDNRKEAAEIFAAMFRGEADSCPLPLITESGLIIPVETRIWLGKWSGEDCVFAIIKDLTREKEENQRFEKLFRNNPALMALLSLPDRTFFDVNDALVNTLGYTREELNGKNPLEINLFVRDEDADFIRTHILSNEPLNNYEIQVRCKNGAILDGLFFADFINSQGKKYFLAVMMDITRQKELERELTFHEKELIRYSEELSRDIDERKQMEILLREKSEELDRYFTSALDLLCIANTKGEFIRINPEWERVLGYSIGELEGKIFLDFVHPDDLEKTLDAIRKLAGQEEIINFENRYRRKDGTYRWIEWRSNPHGDLIYAAARDITDRKQIEDAISQSNQKLRLLTGLTRHDILNLLTAIHAYHEFALDSHSKEEMAEYITRAHEAGKRIETIIGFTREYENFGIASAGWQKIAAIIDSARLEITTGSVIIINQVDPDLEVYADPIIRKVFTTLLENGIRHGGEIHTMRFLSRTENRSLIIQYEDDGKGVRAEDKERIFRHGFGSHTGIGLFLSEEILSITGLSIRETGEEGVGARFEIMVPDGKWRR